MKSILQSEAAECGLASLAMVVDAHGLRVGLPELRRRFSLSLKGARLDHLIRIAQQLGFSTRPLRLDLEELRKLKLPCILHWNLNHFVVLAKVGQDKATILDPAFGERKMPRVCKILCKRDFGLQLRQTALELDGKAVQGGLPVADRHRPFLADVA